MGAYRIGKGKPPKRTRFKKGVSGNPSGRPKGSKNLATELNEELNQKVAVSENGIKRKLSKGRAIIKSVVNKGLQGDAKASATVIALSERYNARHRPEIQAPVGDDERDILRLYLPRLQKLLEQP
jgi:hypothetical protein